MTHEFPSSPGDTVDGPNPTGLAEPSGRTDGGFPDRFRAYLDLAEQRCARLREQLTAADHVTARLRQQLRQQTKEVSPTADEG